MLAAKLEGEIAAMRLVAQPGAPRPISWLQELRSTGHTRPPREERSLARRVYPSPGANGNQARPCEAERESRTPPSTDSVGAVEALAYSSDCNIKGRKPDDTHCASGPRAPELCGVRNRSFRSGQSDSESCAHHAADLEYNNNHMSDQL
jgi:hypothetical protein